MKNGSLVFLSPDRRQELARLTFEHLGIFKLVPEGANAPGRQRYKAEMYCEEMGISADA